MDTGRIGCHLFFQVVNQRFFFLGCRVLHHFFLGFQIFGNAFTHNLIILSLLPGRLQLRLLIVRPDYIATISYLGFLRRKILVLKLGKLRLDILGRGSFIQRTIGFVGAIAFYLIQVGYILVGLCHQSQGAKRSLPGAAFTRNRKIIFRSGFLGPDEKATVRLVVGRVDAGIRHLACKLLKRHAFFHRDRCRLFISDFDLDFAALIDPQVGELRSRSGGTAGIVFDLGAGQISRLCHLRDL